MATFKDLVATHRTQYIILAVLTIGVVGLTGILNRLNSLFFERFLGSLNPLVTILVVAILGFTLLSFLLSKGWFIIYRRRHQKGLLQFSGLAVLFVSVAILVDLKIVYPEDMNIPFPESLLFYPAIAFFVEILFHILPLSMLLFWLTVIFKNVNYKKGYLGLFCDCSLTRAYLSSYLYGLIPDVGYSGHLG